MLTGAVMPRMGRCRTASICRSYNITSESDLIAASEKIEASRQVSTPADKTSTKTDTSAFGADFAPNENAPKWQKNGGDDETRTRDLGRDSLAWIGFTTYENAGTANAKQVAQNHANCGLGCGLERFHNSETTPHSFPRTSFWIVSELQAGSDLGPIPWLLPACHPGVIA